MLAKPSRARLLAASGLVMLGDKGYIGEDDIRTPYRGRNKPASQKEANRTHARLFAPDFQSFMARTFERYVAQGKGLPAAGPVPRAAGPGPWSPRTPDIVRAAERSGRR
jgi:hypothetical protein